MASQGEKQLRIALLIDADNAPAERIDEILTELSTLGEINVRRAYGNWTKSGLNSWQNRLLEFAILPMQQFDYSKKKNATDMAMTVDAMELLYNDKPDAFGIVSSDADFTPLVMHLRSKGAAVYGFGAAQTPKPFVNACSRFLYLESLVSDDEPTLPQASPEAVSTKPAADTPAKETPCTQMPAPPRLRIPGAQLRADSQLMNLLRLAVQASEDESGWARVGAVGQQIGNKTSFDARNYGYASLTKLLAATQAFELRDEGTPRVAVRDKRAARSSASSSMSVAGCDQVA
ncbi:NYN domain-containing protein, partial [Diaphorobacter sp.]|uniref:NYN domain-containing protein n=1 Tax=Diaphorobacter sp. TaxID=1934310 RepID=UPI0028AF4458